jgi:hypothetical protein
LDWTFYANIYKDSLLIRTDYYAFSILADLQILLPFTQGMMGSPQGGQNPSITEFRPNLEEALP